MATKKKAGTKKKSTKVKTVRRAQIIKQPYTRSALLSHIAGSTGLTKIQAASVIDELKLVIEGHVKQGSAQIFTMPGLFKIKVIRKPATKARMGVNPFTGLEMMFKAKPARNVVKIQALKALKEMAK
ncbi:MAG TPA: HU family DNA-binding protein [Gammaproteobacteria bacterium]